MNEDKNVGLATEEFHAPFPPLQTVLSRSCSHINDDIEGLFERTAVLSSIRPPFLEASKAVWNCTGVSAFVKQAILLVNF